MIRMPDTARNLPISADSSSDPSGGQVLHWPHPQPEAQLTSSLLGTVKSYIDAQGGGQGLFPTRMTEVNIIRSFQGHMPMRQIYRPSLCVVVQGAKEILFGEDQLVYGAMECLVVSVELPARGRIIQASVEEPLIGITVDLDVAMIRDVLTQMDAPPAPSAGSGACLFVGKVDQPLADCIARLIRLSDTPAAIPVLFPSVMREICFWLLTGEHGSELCKLALPESNLERVARAVQLLHSDFAQTLRVDQLADVAGMSASSFHQHFKSLTSMTPLQFQKQLRLLEARRLMVASAASVGEAAYKVGYESTSQFSREYARTFGVPPKRDAMNLQQLHRQYANREAKSA